MQIVRDKETEPTPLTVRLADQIAEQIRKDALPPGHRLVERKLAADLRVSRSPVRGALSLLENRGVVAQTEAGGYVVRSPAALTPPRVVDAVHDAAYDEEAIYRRIADDRLSGALPDRVTENELMRRYDISRAALSHILRRSASEGWMERLPGHGWSFEPILTSIDAYRDSIRFRSVIEPAGILLETFSLDRPKLEERRNEQKLLVDGEIQSVSISQLFDLNRMFHESVMACSNNPFFIESLKRTNGLRRLIRYSDKMDRERALSLCREHVTLSELLLDGDREAASFFMRRHLSGLGPQVDVGV